MENPNSDSIPASEGLLAVIHRNYESKSLDYKGPIGWSAQDKKACCELTKDIMAMANTDGGYIVIGVSEEETGFRLDGLAPEQAGTFESSQICRFVQNYADPPVNVRVMKIIHQGLLFVVLEIPRFSDTPHLCQKTFPDVLRERELYVRTDNNESAPIKSSSDFRALIETSIRNRTDSLLSSFRAILGGSAAGEIASPSDEERFRGQIDAARAQFSLLNPLGGKSYDYYIETVFEPTTFDKYRFVTNRLESAAQHAHIDFVGWPFLFFPSTRRELLSQTDEGIEVLISTTDFANQDILDYWRLNESGLFYKRELTPTLNMPPATTSAPRILWQFAEAIYCLSRLYEWLLSDSDLITLYITIHGTRGRTLVWQEKGFYHRTYQANRPQIEARATHTLAEWRAGLEDHAVGLSREVFRFFQLDNPDEAMMRSQIRNILQRRL
jgi:schlafen family protein